MKKAIKGSWWLQKGRKYTILLFNGKVFQRWFNEDIATTLKTADFDEQVEWFRNKLKG